MSPTILKIEHRLARQNLGESDAVYAQQYVSALTAALTAEYPAAEVVVNLNSDFYNTSQTFVSGSPDTGPDDFEIRENVGIIANRVWEKL